VPGVRTIRSFLSGEAGASGLVLDLRPPIRPRPRALGRSSLGSVQGGYIGVEWLHPIVRSVA
jgi:hypothetical protein